MEDRLSLSVTTADGKTVRWGPDEPDPVDIPNDLQFTGAIPGGHKTLACSLIRDIRTAYPDLGLLNDVRLYGAGNESVWEGRHQNFPRQHDGGTKAVTPNAVGWVSHLADDPSFREIYVDQDKTQWQGGASVARKSALLGTYAVADGQVVQDPSTGQAALMCEATGKWGATTQPEIEAFYDSQGIPLAELRYSWKIGSTINVTDTNWDWRVALDDSADTFGATDLGTNQRAAGPAIGRNLLASAYTRLFAKVRLLYGAAGGTDGGSWPLFWTALAVYGLHGLTRQGSDTAVTCKGLLLTDILRDAVTRGAPLLTVNGVQDSTTVLPHCVYRDPITAQDVVTDLNKYALWKWGVYDDRDFFFAPWGAGDDAWEVRLADGIGLSLDGDDVESLFNGVLVVFTDFNGRRRIVGPPGALADVTDASLADTRPNNPVNAHGIPRRWGKLELSGPTSDAAAIALGQVWLAEHSRAQRKGSLTVTGKAFHPQRGWRPVSRIRSGEHVRIVDHPYSGPRRIVEHSYRHANRAMTLTLDNSSFLLDSILEKMGIALVGVLS